MFRRGLFEFPAWHFRRHLPWGDRVIHTLNALAGGIGVLDEPMAVRRIHDDGTWSKLDRATQLRSQMKSQRLIHAHLPREYDADLREFLRADYRRLADHLAGEGKRLRSHWYGLRSAWCAR